jgi:hypothetical protein
MWYRSNILVEVEANLSQETLKNVSDILSLDGDLENDVTVNLQYVSFRLLK